MTERNTCAHWKGWHDRKSLGYGQTPEECKVCKGNPRYAQKIDCKDYFCLEETPREQGSPRTEGREVADDAAGDVYLSEVRESSAEPRALGATGKGKKGEGRSLADRLREHAELGDARGRAKFYADEV